MKNNSTFLLSALALSVSTLLSGNAVADDAAVNTANTSAVSNIAAASSTSSQGIYEQITVEGRFLSVNESNSIKSPTPILDVPQSLTIITAEDILERGFHSIGQIVDYTPGLNTSQGEGHRDSVVFRGIRSTADFFIDGNRDDVQYYRSLYNVEKVEVLRGPNALLFGRGGTGGVINRVSKKAIIDQSFTGYKTTVDTFGGYGLDLDVNTETSDNSAVRLNFTYESLENHRDFYYGDRIGFNPTARLQLSDVTTLDLSYEYIDHERFIDRGIPTGANGEPVEALEDIVFGDKENNYHTLEAHVARATLQHRFSANVKGNFSAFYGTYNKVYANFYATAFDADTNVAELDGYIDDTRRDNVILSANIVNEFSTGDIEHTLIYGGEYIETDSNQFRLNPVFSTNSDDRENFLVNRPLTINGLSGTNAQGQAFTVPFADLNDDTRVDLKVTSAYIQNEMALSEQFDVVLGARFDTFDIEVFNALPSVLETRTRKDEEISPRAGVIYKPQENVSVYASYSESFLPRSGEQYTDINGNDDQLDPNTYTNQEIGVKWDFASGLSLTAAYFENEQSSPQVADNDPSTLDVVDSEITGFEIQLYGSITDDLSINANFSSLDGEIVDRNGPTGRSPRELPETTFSVWSSYQVTDKFGLGLGVTYQDESFINTSNSAVLPSYTRVDAAAYFDLTDDLRLQVNIENLTDELYFPNAHSTHQATVAEPLNAMFSIIGKL